MTPALRKVTRAAEKASSAAILRNQAIQAAHGSGATIRAIALAAGLSTARIHQILHGR